MQRVVPHDEWLPVSYPPWARRFSHESPICPGRSVDRMPVSDAGDAGSSPARGAANAVKRGRFHRVVGRAAGGARWKIYHQVLLRGRLADIGREVFPQVVPEGWSARLLCQVRVLGAASAARCWVVSGVFLSKWSESGRGSFEKCSANQIYELRVTIYEL